jgi:hypothetical protein
MAWPANRLCRGSSGAWADALGLEQGIGPFTQATEPGVSAVGVLMAEGLVSVLVY